MQGKKANQEKKKKHYRCARALFFSLSLIFVVCAIDRGNEVLSSNAKKHNKRDLGRTVVVCAKEKGSLFDSAMHPSRDGRYIDFITHTTHTTHIHTHTQDEEQRGGAIAPHFHSVRMPRQKKAGSAAICRLLCFCGQRLVGNV